MSLKPGLHADGGNLYLQVTDGANGNRRRSWVLRYQLKGGKRRDMGLGPLDTVSLDEARDYRKLIKEGIDPIAHRDAEVAANIAKNMDIHVSPMIGSMSIAKITTAHVMRVLNPIWLEKTETASRVRGRIESIPGGAAVPGFRSGDNPARWHGHLDNLLAPPRKVRTVRH